MEENRKLDEIFAIRTKYMVDLAASMIEKWGMIAAVEDGEDTRGRQKLRMLSPTELVNRAFETSELFANRVDAIRSDELKKKMKAFLEEKITRAE
jgi:hypothetical protein